MFDQSRLNYHDLEEYANAQEERSENVHDSYSTLQGQHTKALEELALTNEKLTQGKLHYAKENKSSQEAVLMSMQLKYDKKIKELNEIVQSKDNSSKQMHAEYEGKFDLLKRGYDQQKGIADKLTSELTLDFSQADTVSKLFDALCPT